MRRKPRLIEVILIVSLIGLIGLFALLIIVRPPLVFLTLFLIPIALATVLYEYTGGTLAALGIMTAVALLVALDPDTYRRATVLQEVWPILVAYLAVGPLIGWLVARERGRQDQLNAATRRLHQVELERVRALAVISEAGQEMDSLFGLLSLEQLLALLRIGIGLW